MSLRLIIGRSGTGKSTLCISEIKKRNLSSSAKKIIMLVPEQYTFETENKLLHEVGEKFQLNTYVLSFQRLAHKVFSEHGGITKLRMQEAKLSKMAKLVIRRTLASWNFEMLFPTIIYVKKDSSTILFPR